MSYLDWTKHLQVWLSIIGNHCLFKSSKLLFFFLFNMSLANTYSLSLYFLVKNSKKFLFPKLFWEIFFTPYVMFPSKYNTSKVKSHLIISLLSVISCKVKNSLKNEKKVWVINTSAKKSSFEWDAFSFIQLTKLKKGNNSCNIYKVLLYKEIFILRDIF